MTNYGKKEVEYLYNTYYDVLVKKSVRITGDTSKSEDIVSDMFVWLLERKHFPTKNCIGLLIKILRHRLIDNFRKDKCRKVIFDSTLVEKTDLATYSEPPPDGWDSRIQYALDKLSVPLYTTFILLNVDGYTHQEVAKLLNKPIGTILSRSYRSKKKFRQYYKEYQDV